MDRIDRVVLESIELWQREACPRPDVHTLSAGLGYHLEEINETLSAIELDDAHEYLKRELCQMLDSLSHALKRGRARVVNMDRREVLDGLADQIVTAVGFGYRARMNVPAATVAVDTSNWSKFTADGRAVRDEHGKVVKGPSYRPPNLEGLY